MDEQQQELAAFQSSINDTEATDPNTTAADDAVAVTGQEPAGATDAAPLKMEGDVHRTRRLALPQDVHQAVLVATTDEQAIGRQDPADDRGVRGTRTVEHRQQRHLVRANLPEHGLVATPCALRIFAGRRDQRDAGIGSTAHRNETTQDHAVLKSILVATDHHQAADAPTDGW